MARPPLYKSKGQINREQHLANVANSVSGFYKDHGGAMSEHGSNMSRTQDNFASNLVNPRRSSGNEGQYNNEGSPRRDPNGNYTRIYGSAKGGAIGQGPIAGYAP